jgi:hypothetical protein
MKTYHIHIYQITGKAEANMKAINAKEAKQMIINNEDLKFKKSDCKRIAIAFKIKECRI